MTKAMKDVVSGSLLLVLAAAIFVAAFDIEKVLPVGVGSGFFPKVVAVVLAMVAGLILAQGLRAAVREGRRPASTAPANGAGRVVAATLVLIGFYVGCLEPLGFIPTTFLYLFGQFAVLAPKGRRNPTAFAAVAAIVSVGTYYTFLTVFDLMLPTGILG